MLVDTNRYLGYPDRISVPAGERIVFQLSSHEQAAHVSVVRFRCADSDATGPGLKYEIVPSPLDGTHACMHQPIVPGSAVIVPHAPALVPEKTWSVGCYAWPTRPTASPQTLLSRWRDDTATGYALQITAEGGLALRLGRAGATPLVIDTGVAIDTRHWYWFSATIDLERGEVHLCQRRLAEGPVAEVRIDRRHTLEDALTVDAHATAFVIAAHHADAHALTGHFDGKIDRPRIVANAIDATALAAVTAEAHRVGIAPGDLVAWWDFSVGISTLDVEDRGPNALHGRLHQLPRRGVTGVMWSGDTHDFRLAPHEYSAIHFHSDDLYDCGWQPSLSLHVPDDWRSGIYALRLRHTGDGDNAAIDVAAESFVVFFITPGKQSKRARLAIVASVASYMAYANSALRLYHVHFQGLMERVLHLTMDDIYLHEHPEIAQSTYDTHIDGSGRSYSSWLRPILNIRPRANPFNLVTDSHFTDWLDEKGIDYDLITDVELDREGARALAPYPVVCTLSHPEYYTRNMMQAVMGYQNRGGRHFCLGANSFYWRCAFHPHAPAALEVRRGMCGTRTWESYPGEVNLASTGEPGALWRHSGYAPQRLIGVGFSAMLYDQPGYFVRTPAARDPRVAFAVAGIEEGERIGNFGVRIGGAVGIEIDRYDRDLGSPAHAIMVATSHGLGPGALPTPEEFRTMVHGLDGEQNALVRADMVFFETPQGGAVFVTGSISYVLSLSHNGYDNNVSRLTENVLRRFLDPAPFPASFPPP